MDTRFGVGTNSPSATAHFKGGSGGIRIERGGNPYIELYNATTALAQIRGLAAPGGVGLGAGTGTVNWFTAAALGIGVGTNILATSSKAFYVSNLSSSASAFFEATTGTVLGNPFELLTLNTKSSPAVDALNTGYGGLMTFKLRDSTVGSFGFSKEGSVTNSGVFRLNSYSAGVATNTLTISSTGQLALGVTTPAASSIADFTSTTKAFYPPRMTKTQRDAISSPVAGAVVYQTDNTPGLRVYNGTNWMRFTETID